MQEIYIKQGNNDLACPLYNLISTTAIERLRSNRKVQREGVVFLILCYSDEKAQQVDLLKQL